MNESIVLNLITCESRRTSVNFTLDSNSLQRAAVFKIDAVRFPRRLNTKTRFWESSVSGAKSAVMSE